MTLKSRTVYLSVLMMFMSGCGDAPKARTAALPASSVPAVNADTVNIREMRDLGLEQLFDEDDFTSRPEQDPRLRIHGYLEYVQIVPGNRVMKAKLDTGALTSSLDTLSFEEFEKNGKTWVRFTYVGGRGKQVTVEREKIRTSQIKTHTNKTSDRPVVKMTLHIGDRSVETEVNLADRKNFNYPILLGRKFLRDAGVAVDPQRSFTIPRSTYEENTP